MVAGGWPASEKLCVFRGDAAPPLPPYLAIQGESQPAQTWGGGVACPVGIQPWGGLGVAEGNAPGCMHTWAQTQVALSAPLGPKVRTRQELQTQKLKYLTFPVPGKAP